jgi:hypothetical protein
VSSHESSLFELDGEEPVEESEPGLESLSEGEITQG